MPSAQGPSGARDVARGRQHVAAIGPASRPGAHPLEHDVGVRQPSGQTVGETEVTRLIVVDGLQARAGEPCMLELLQRCDRPRGVAPVERRRALQERILHPRLHSARITARHRSLDLRGVVHQAIHVGQVEPDEAERKVAGAVDAGDVGLERVAIERHVPDHFGRTHEVRDRRAARDRSRRSCGKKVPALAPGHFFALSRIDQIVHRRPPDARPSRDQRHRPMQLDLCLGRPPGVHQREPPAQCENATRLVIRARAKAPGRNASASSRRSWLNR